MEKLNTLDKLKSYFNPEYAVKATHYRNIASSLEGQYDISVPTENYDIGYFTTEEQDIEDLDIARNTARLKVKNNGFAKAVLKCATDHVIGTGLRSKSTLNRRKLKNLSEERIKEIENTIDDYVSEWIDSQYSDITGHNNFFLQQRLAYYTFKRDGEVFATLPIKDQNINLKLIGAEYIEGDGEGYSFGIKKDKDKRPIAYKIVNHETNEHQIVSNSLVKINMLHVFERERIETSRGFPFIAPIARDLDYIDQYMKAELNAAKIAALLLGSIETQSTGDIFKKPNSDLTGMQSSNPKIDNTRLSFTENQITQLRTGEKLNIHHQGRDNPNIDKMIETSLKKVSACTRIPVEVLLSIFTSSYSASRASMLLMQMFTKPERMLFNRQFNNPVRDQVIEWGILKGDLDIPGYFENKKAYNRCEWIGDSIGSVDPVKDANAKKTLIESRLTTYTKATRELGQGDFEDNAKQLEKENQILEKSNLNEGVENDED